MNLGREIEPLVFRNKIAHWPASGWTLEALREILQDEELHFRFGKRNDAIVQMETECTHKKVSLGTFQDWLAGRSPSSLSEFSRNDYWGYSDYNRIQERFANNKAIVEAVDWSGFGFPGRDGNDSTLWIGSKGSYTVCHQDSYGCNLVAQIRGRKRWVLFPPEDRDCLYPTRLPFEESSVFSTVNILRPDLGEHHRFAQAQAYVLTMEPGDVLFVPRHWWHHVQNLDDAISINTWIDLPEDAEERTREALTKSIAYAMMSHKPLTTWLNPTEEQSSPHQNLQELNLSLHSVADLEETKAKDEHEDKQSSQACSSPSRKRTWQGSEGDAPDAKKRLTNSGEVHSNKAFISSGVQEKISCIPGGTKLQKCNFVQLENLLNPSASHFPGPQTSGLSHGMTVLNVSGMSESTEDLVTRGSQESIERKGLTLGDLTDCLLDREVVELIRKKVQNKYTEINR